MKRILHVVGGMKRAGAETMIMNLYRKLDRDKYQFDFVLFTAEETDYDKEIISLGGRIFYIPDASSKNPIKRTIASYKLIRNQGPFHAVHAHQLFSNAFHLLAANLAGIDMRISHSHNTSDANSKSVLGRLYQKFARLLIRFNTTHYIACGEQAGEFLFPWRKEVLFLPNAINVDDFKRVEKTTIERIIERTLNENTTIICQVGRLNPVKNHDFTLNFAKYLLERNFDFQILIIGDGPLKDTLIDKSKALLLDKHVTFTGVRSDVNKIMGASDLMLMPSFHEGFPVVLVEAQAAGLPSLISANISPEVDLGLELIRFAELDHSHQIWYDKLNELLKLNKPSHEKRREKLSLKGFDINTSIQKLEAVYAKEE